MVLPLPHLPASVTLVAFLSSPHLGTSQDFVVPGSWAHGPTLCWCSSGSAAAWPGSDCGNRAQDLVPAARRHQGPARLMGLKGLRWSWTFGPLVYFLLFCITNKIRMTSHEHYVWVAPACRAIRCASVEAMFMIRCPLPAILRCHCQGEVCAPPWRPECNWVKTIIKRSMAFEIC
jgi:hypothetical protein